MPGTPELEALRLHLYQWMQRASVALPHKWLDLADSVEKVGLPKLPVH
jgi:hypothetical protein